MKNLIGLFIFLFISLITISTTNSLATTASSNTCKFGGKCELRSDGECTCTCVMGFGGASCEIILTQISGLAKYTVPNSRPINDAQFETLVQASVSSNYSVTIEETSQNNTNFFIPFVFYIERPSSWVDYEDAVVLQQSLSSTLSSSESTQKVFGTTNGISFADVTTNVDECASNWTNCNPRAGCINRDPGFICVCDIGYQGDGIECSPITCKLSNAPSPPSLGNRTFNDVNGTAITNPEEDLPYATSIEYQCPRRYEMVDGKGESIGLQTSACQNVGWTPVIKARCSMDLGFRIALGIAITSSLIILIVIGGFITHWCLAAERRAKAKNRQSLSREELSLEAMDWNEI